MKITTRTVLFAFGIAVGTTLGYGSSEEPSDASFHETGGFWGFLEDMDPPQMSEESLQRSQERLQRLQERLEIMPVFMKEYDSLLSFEDEFRRTFGEDVSSIERKWIAEFGIKIIENSADETLEVLFDKIDQWGEQKADEIDGKFSIEDIDSFKIKLKTMVKNKPKNWLKAFLFEKWVRSLANCEDE